MAIKMRKNLKPNAICCECGGGQEDALQIFDLCIGKTILTVCDMCNEKIMYKTLHADVAIDSKVKTSRDMAIIRRRNGDDKF